MSSSDKDRPPRAAEETPEASAQEPEEGKPPYVFKILPADPKNSLEFEDMADK